MQPTAAGHCGIMRHRTAAADARSLDRLAVKGFSKNPRATIRAASTNRGLRGCTTRDQVRGLAGAPHAPAIARSIRVPVFVAGTEVTVATGAFRGRGDAGGAGRRLHPHSAV